VKEPKLQNKVIRQINFKSSDLQDKSKDDFIRHWIQVLNLGDLSNRATQEGHLVRIFVDTRANVNTISRGYLSLLREDNVEMENVKGPRRGTSI
jgi:hypothetical protein